MLVAELESIVGACPEEVLNYDLYLACSDRVVADNADEQTALIGGIDVCVEQAEARLYPPFSPKADDEDQCYTLADLFATLKDKPTFQSDLRLVAELPLIREESVNYETSIVPIVLMHVGTEAQEVWLLLGLPSEFPPNSLPS